jgi:para-nitrobenzyl esterase
MSDLIVTTAAGPVQGVEVDGVARFLGVPYAAAPVGAHRFAPPEPHAPWSEVRDASAHGPNAPQIIRPFDGLDIAAMVGDGWREGDDYLTVNIWSPDIQASGRPVMVFIHGGAFTGGCNDAPVQDGAAFARSGVVCMTINYRLGVDGFLAIEGAPTNLGLRDMIAALAWVRDNAAAFGGDPDNVTVFGESAGAMALADLVTSPLAKGLMKRAIIQSGHGEMVRSIPVARKLAAKVAKLLGVAPDLAGFRAVPIRKALAAMEKVQLPGSGLDLREANGREPAYGLSKFLPVYGDDVLPERPHDALARGAGAEIEVLIGSNAEEMNLYFVPTGVKKTFNRFLAWFLLRGAMPRAWAVLKAYGMGRGDGGGVVMTRAMSDLVFRLPARRFAAAHQGRTHVYEFEWGSPAFNGELGACHALEIPFVFNTLACCTGPKGFVGEAPPQDLADRVHALWVGYATDGSLPWAEYRDHASPVYRLAAEVAAPEPDYPAAAFWP